MSLIRARLMRAKMAPESNRQFLKLWKESENWISCPRVQTIYHLLVNWRLLVLIIMQFEIYKWIQWIFWSTITPILFHDVYFKYLLQVLQISLMPSIAVKYYYKSYKITQVRITGAYDLSIAVHPDFRFLASDAIRRPRIPTRKNIGGKFQQ